MYAPLSASVFAAGLACICFGQSPSEPAWTDSTITKVIPGMRREFEGNLKQLMAAYKKAGAPWFLTFETFAGDTTEYTTVTPVMKFGDLDGPSAVLKTLGVAASERLSRNMARCYTAQARQYATPNTALEINRTDAPLGEYWVESHRRLRRAS